MQPNKNQNVLIEAVYLKVIETPDILDNILSNQVESEERCTIGLGWLVLAWKLLF